MDEAVPSSPVFDLGVNDYLKSSDGSYVLILQPDSHVTLLDRNDSFVWHLEQTGERVGIEGGHFILRAADGTAAWTSAQFRQVTMRLGGVLTLQVSTTGKVQVAGPGARYCWICAEVDHLGGRQHLAFSITRAQVEVNLSPGQPPGGQFAHHVSEGVCGRAANVTFAVPVATAWAVCRVR